MSLAGKSFKNNFTGDIIQVIDSFENIAILLDKQKIDVKSLMDTNKYTEQIDPSSFFNNQGSYNILAEKIKTIPAHLMGDEGGDFTPQTTIGGEFAPLSNESAVYMSTEDDEKAELARKYGVATEDNALERQNQAFAKLLGEEAAPVDTLPVVTTRPTPVPTPNQVAPLPQNTKPVEVEDPITTMFKRSKRNVEFKISVEIQDKIPRLDFIEMMEDSYEISIIDFLADEFTNKILADPSLIRESVKSKIKQLVYGGAIKEINPQITDAVTQANPPTLPTDRILKGGELPTKLKTTPRKPRAKKEEVQK